jgi:uridine kinase
MERALAALKAGRPEDVPEYKEMELPANESFFTDEEISKMKEEMLRRVGKGDGFVIAEGFLLLHSAHLRGLFSSAIFIHGDHDTLKARRESREGYVTLEGRP